MALAKLWTALFGKREETAKAAVSVTGTDKVPAASADGPKLAISKGPGNPAGVPSFASSTEPERKAVAVKAESKKAKFDSEANSPKRKVGKNADVIAPAQAVASAPAAPAKQFQRRQTAWTKRIGNHSITSILDLTVADGSHFVELMESIVDSSSPSVKYVTISRFEMDGQPLTLQQFHKRVRLLGGAPVAIPMELTDGLRHLSQTIGTVDLILLNRADQLADPGLNKLFKRVMRPSTLAFARDGKGVWQAVATGLNESASKPAIVRYASTSEPSLQPSKPRKAA